MAQEVQKQKIRKKKWFSLIAPKLFNEVVIGEMPLYEQEQMLGRKTEANMMALTGNPKRQNINITLRIIEAKDGKGYTEITGFEMTPSSVKRLARRGRSKIEDSVVIETVDGKKVRVKPLLVANSLVSNSVVTSVRIKVRNELARLGSKLSYDKLVEEIATFKMHKHLGTIANQVTPIRISEIRAFLLVEREGVAPIKPVAERVAKRSKKMISEEMPEDAPEAKEGAETEDSEAKESESQETASDDEEKME